MTSNAYIGCHRKLLATGDWRQVRVVNATSRPVDRWIDRDGLFKNRYGKVPMSRHVSALVDAARDGDLVAVQQLVRQGAEKDKVNEKGDGWSPLTAAAAKGHIAVMQYLVEQGADKDKAKLNGSTPLILAVINGHVAAVRYLWEQGASKGVRGSAELLRTACYWDRVDVAAYLLEQGCNVNHVIYNDGCTILHTAARSGNLAMVQLLFRWGTKLNVQDRNGRTPADIATQHGYHQIADAIRVEMKWAERRMAMFVAFKATVAEGAKKPLLARFRKKCPDIMWGWGPWR